MVAEDCGATRMDAVIDRKSGVMTVLGPKRRGSRAAEAVVKSEAASTPPSQQHAGGWNLATIKEGGKRAKPEAPKFLLLLYEILKVEDSNIIRWSEDGLAVQILDPVVVTENILPKYFNHTNFHSFQRQLNYFGFRKWTKSKTDICTFSHPYFRQHQPELLQVIKRKKAPRRTAAGAASTKAAAAKTTDADAASQSSKKLQSLSPCGKRKLPADSASEGFSVQDAGMHLQMNTLGIPIQPAFTGVASSAMRTPHGATSSGMLTFSSQDGGLARQFLPGSTLLNNVISPVAATECKKKAKKMDKKEYLSSTTLHAPISSPTESCKSHASSSSGLNGAGFVLPSSATTSNSAPSSNTSCASSDAAPARPNGFTTTALPTLDIVRSRIIQRQQAGGPEQPMFLQPQQSNFSAFAVPSSSQGTATPVLENRPDVLAQPLSMGSLSRPDLNAGPNASFSNSFSDPVDILLRIKKSRTSSGDSKDATMGQEEMNDQNALHNFLLKHSLYTNRLESQLKIALEENESMKHLLEAKQREVDSLQYERKVLHHENEVLADDKNKLFEINQNLLSKLFPQ